MRATQMNRARRVRKALGGAVAACITAALAPAAHAIVQDFNRARGADGYQLTDTGGFHTGTFDGQEYQPAPSSPGLSGEFFFVSADVGQPYTFDVHAPLGQGVTNTPADHGGYMFVDYKGAYGGDPNGIFQWQGGLGNTVGYFPGIVFNGSGNQVSVPPLSQVLAYADILAPAGKKFRYYLNSPYDGQPHELIFTGTGTGAWQTVGGTLAQATPLNGGVIYSNAPFTTPNQVAMTVEFGDGTKGDQIANWDNGTTTGPAVIRVDNLTFTPASVTWGGTSGGNWSDDTKWTPLLPGGIPAAPSGRNATAIFGSSAAPQTVSLDAPVVQPWTAGGGGDYPTNNNFYIGTLIFNSNASYTLAGPEPIHIDTTAANGVNLAGPGGVIQVASGSHTISAPVILQRSTTLDVAAGSNLSITGPLAVFASDGQPVTLAKASGGTAVVNNVRVTGSLDVSGGVLRIKPDATAAGASFVPGAITVAPGAQFDLTNNKLVTQNPVGSASGGTYNGVSRLIQSGRNGGNWSGSGIVTSQSQATITGLTSIGVATAAQVKGIPASATSTWAGQTVTGSDALVMYTYAGDANLDGKIDVLDYGRIDLNVPLGVSGWYNGDFNYDGKIDVLDYGIIDFNIAIQGPPIPSGASGSVALSAVPEPASIALVTVGAAALLMRRSRRED